MWKETTHHQFQNFFLFTYSWIFFPSPSLRTSLSDRLVRQPEHLWRQRFLATPNSLLLSVAHFSLYLELIISFCFHSKHRTFMALLWEDSQMINRKRLFPDLEQVVLTNMVDSVNSKRNIWWRKVIIGDEPIVWPGANCLYFGYGKE